MRRLLMAGAVLALCAATVPAPAHAISGACAIAMSTLSAKETGLQNHVARSIDEIAADLSAWRKASHPSDKALSKRLVASYWIASINRDSSESPKFEYYDVVDVNDYAWTWFRSASRETLSLERKLLEVHEFLPLAKLKGTSQWLMWHEDGMYAEPLGHDDVMRGPSGTAWPTMSSGISEFGLAWAIGWAVADARASLYRLIVQRDEAREAIFAACES